jgi:prepilin-type N-terminal cleavage/methylation domain-containing protein
MNHRRGFTLVEILLAISLLGAFMLIASRVLEENFHVDSDLAMAQNTSARFDHAVRAMRDDVLHSVSIELSGAHMIRLKSSEQQTIEWTADHDSLSRKATGQTSTWHVGQPMSITLDQAVVLLCITPSNQIAMASAQSCSGGAK